MFLVLRTNDRNPGQPGAYLAGDVIAALPDSHQFSPAELVDPFRVVQIVGIDERAMDSYLIGNWSTRRSQGFEFTPALAGILPAGQITQLNRAQAWALLNLSRER